MNVTHKKTLQSWVALMFAMIMVFTIPMTVQASVPGTSTLETVDSNTVKEKIPYIHKHTGSPTSGGGCYTPVYHSHTGSSSSGGGCYTTPNYHQHTSSCYTNEYHQHDSYSCYMGHNASCYHSHSSSCKHSHVSSCYHSHTSSCKHSHVSSCYTHQGGRYNLSLLRMGDSGPYSWPNMSKYGASMCYATTWSGSTKNWSFSCWQGAVSVTCNFNSIPTRVTLDKSESSSTTTYVSSKTSPYNTTTNLYKVGSTCDSKSVTCIIQWTVSNSSSQMGCILYANRSTCKISCGKNTTSYYCGYTTSDTVCGKNTTTNYCGKTSGTSGTLECGYSQGHIQGASYGRRLVCGKTTSTIENTYLHCTKTPGVTVDSWSLGCGKTPSTIDSYRLACGYNEGDVEKYVYIHYHLDGGTLTKTSTLDSGQTTRTLPIPEKEKYSFVAWHLSSSSGSKISTTDPLPANDIHVYVEWEECSGTVYFKDTATGESIAEPKLAGKTTVLKNILPDYKKDGYETSWWLDRAATNALPDTLTMSADEDEMTIWVHLTPITYVVEVYDSINPDPIDTKTIKYDEWLQLPTINTKNPGHQHAGWTKDTDPTLLNVENGRIKNLTANKGDIIKLYAYWKDISSYVVALPALIDMQYDDARQMFVGNYSVTADGDIPNSKYVSVAAKSNEITLTGEKTGNKDTARVLQTANGWANSATTSMVKLGTVVPGQVTSEIDPDKVYDEDYTSEVKFVFSLKSR